jgi:hypothetical protein
LCFFVVVCAAAAIAAAAFVVTSLFVVLVVDVVDFNASLVFDVFAAPFVFVVVLLVVAATLTFDSLGVFLPVVGSL